MERRRTCTERIAGWASVLAFLKRGREGIEDVSGCDVGNTGVSAQFGRLLARFGLNWLEQTAAFWTGGIAESKEADTEKEEERPAAPK